jgi:hypothetical protein
VAGFISDGGREIGTVADIKSESLAGLRRIASSAESQLLTSKRRSRRAL